MEQCIPPFGLFYYNEDEVRIKYSCLFYIVVRVLVYNIFWNSTIILSFWLSWLLDMISVVNVTLVYPSFKALLGVRRACVVSILWAQRVQVWAGVLEHIIYPGIKWVSTTINLNFFQLLIIILFSLACIYCLHILNWVRLENSQMQGEGI